MLLEIGIVLISILFIFVRIVTKNNGFWKKKKVPHQTPEFLFGNIKDVLLFRKSFIDTITDFCGKFHEYKYFGMYFGRTPALIVQDTELARTVLIKDFNWFQDTSIKAHPEADPLFEHNPFCQRGAKWKTIRSQLSPLFTTGKMKNMFESMLVSCDRLKNHILKNISSYENGVDVHILGRQYTVENFCLNGLTITPNAFENPDDDFLKIAQRLFNTENWEALISYCVMVMDPDLGYLLKRKFANTSEANLIRRAVDNVLKHRTVNKISYNDYFDQVRNLAEKYPDDPDFLNAHIYTLFLDGVETSASALRSLIYEVSQNPEVTKKLRYEIDTVMANYDKLTYEALQEMKYLDCCLTEALRLHPPLGFLLRICTETYQLPPQKDSPSGVTLDKGTMVVVAVKALQHNAENYINPKEFRPERERCGAYMAFGEGPRLCLGSRYAIQQVKMAAVTLIQNFDITLNEKTPVPLRDVGVSFFFVPSKPVIVNIRQRKDVN